MLQTDEVAAELICDGVHVHPALVRKNIDAKIREREATVGLRDLPQRLANLDLPLDATGVAMIERFARWRNDIVHHAPSFDRHQARVELPTLLDFIARYLHQKLGTQLRDFLPKELYRVALRVLEEWQGMVATAIGRAEAEGHVLDEACRDCGAHDVLTVRENQHVYCHACGSKDYVREWCAECGRQVLVSMYLLDTPVTCDLCIMGVGDRVAALEDEARRGK